MMTAAAASSPELAVTALVVEDGRKRHVLGPCTVIWRHDRVVGVAASDVVREVDPARLRIMTGLDGATTLPLEPPRMTRYEGSMQMRVRCDHWAARDVVPVHSRALAPPAACDEGRATLVAIAPQGSGFRRVEIPVTVDGLTVGKRGGAGDDVDLVFAYVDAPPPPDVLHDGAPLMVAHAASRLYGRPAETLIRGIASTRRAAHPPGRPAAFAWLHMVELRADPR